MDGYPDSLYKYISLNSPHYKDILHRRLYFSPPRLLNDPDDCRNPFRNDLMEDEHLSRMKEDLQFPGTIREMRIKILEAESNGYNKITNSQFLSRLGVFCTCESPVEMHLWEQYASDGNGFVVGLKASDFIFQRSVAGFGSKILYVPKFETLIPYSEPSEVLTIKKMFIKLDSYKKEEEYRLVKWGIKKRLKQFPETSFQCVILGYNVDESKRKIIIQMVNKYMPDVILKEAEKHIEKISISDIKG